MINARPIFTSLYPTSAHRPITYAQAKSFLRLNSDTDQTNVEFLIDAATSYAENLCNRLFISRQITAAANKFDTVIYLFGSNVSSLSAAYYSVDNVLTSAGDLFFIDNSHVCARAVAIKDVTFPEVYDRPGSIVLTYTTGMGSIASVPAAIKQALLFLVSDMYENRSFDLSTFKSESPMSIAANNLLNLYKLEAEYHE